MVDDANDPRLFYQNWIAWAKALPEGARVWLSADDFECLELARFDWYLEQSLPLPAPTPIIWIRSIRVARKADRYCDAYRQSPNHHA